MGTANQAGKNGAKRAALTIFCGLVVFCAAEMSLLADGLTFTSFQDGEWFGISETNRQQSNQYSDILGISTIDPKYSGTRWISNPLREEILLIHPDTPPGYTLQLSYPGSTYLTTGDMDDTAIINHRITLSSPNIASGSGTMYLGTLTIHSSGSLTVKSVSLLHVDNVTNNGTLNFSLDDMTSGAIETDTITNYGIINVHNSNTAPISSDRIVNERTGTLNLFAIGNSFTAQAIENAGIISLRNGSTIGSSTTPITVNEGSKFTVHGKDNVIIASNLIVNAKLTISGTDAPKDFVKLDASSITGRGANQFDFRNVTVEFASSYYGSATEYKVGQENGWELGSVLAGAGNPNVHFTITGGRGLNPGSSPGTFRGTDFTFENKSVLYIEIGKQSDGYDQLLASDNVTFADDTKIVLLNFGNHKESYTAEDIVKTTAGAITVGSEVLNTTAVRYDGNKAIISDTGGNNKLTIVSATSSSGDVIKINNVLKTDRSLSVNVEGVEVNLNSGGKGQANFSALFDSLFDPGVSDLNAAIDAHAGAYIDDIKNAVMQLDPVMVSVGYQQSFGFVQKVTAAGRNRMFNRMNQYYPGMLMQMNPGGQYLGQEPGDHRSMERLLAELADEPVAASPYLHPPVPGVLPPHGMATPHEVMTAGGVSNLWGEIFGGGQIQETTRLVKGWKNSSGGFAVGRDRLLPMYHALIGFSFGAGFDSARSEDKNNRAESEQMFFSFYGSKKWRNWLLTGSFGYSHAELESTRYALNNGQARGIRNAGTWFGNLEAARRCELIHRRGGASYFEPYISWELISYEENAFTESGNYIAMAFDRRNESTGLSTVGFRLGSLIPECWGLRCMKPELSFGWIHDFNGGPSQMTAKWAAGGSVPMLLYGTPRHGDRIAGGIKFEADVSRRLTMFFRYDGEYAKNYGGHYVSSGVNVMF